MQYQVEPISRRCAATGRELKPGERFYTALLSQGSQLARQDFSAEAWHGPPPEAFSFWTGRVPPLESASKPRFDDDLLEECFARLAGETDPARVNFRYVVALLLIRRKRYKLEASRTEDGIQTMIVRCLRTNEKCEVVHPRLTDDELQAVQDEVFHVLGWK